LAYTSSLHASTHAGATGIRELANIKRPSFDDRPAVPRAPAANYPEFLEALRNSGFRGQISADYGTRTVLATDNSIYQRLPQAAVFPLDADDVARVATLMAEPRFQQVKLTRAAVAPAPTASR
jgi:hypothetical protein